MQPRKHEDAKGPRKRKEISCHEFRPHSPTNWKCRWIARSDAVSMCTRSRAATCRCPECNHENTKTRRIHEEERKSYATSSEPTPRRTGRPRASHDRMLYRRASGARSWPARGHLQKSHLYRTARRGDSLRMRKGDAGDVSGRIPL